MKSIIVLGNWKANKTIQEARGWIDAFARYAKDVPQSTKVIICPAYHHIPLFIDAMLPLVLGAQDISAYPSGAFTGEISARMMPDVSYVLIGHSERRTHMAETDEVIAQKAVSALENNILPVVCVSEVEQVKKLKEHVPNFSQKGMLLYEPLFAIGSGKADNPEHANASAQALLELMPGVPILYGGSVTPDNVLGFVTQPCLAGVGVGGASLDPEKFFKLILAASSV